MTISPVSFGADKLYNPFYNCLRLCRLIGTASFVACRSNIALGSLPGECTGVPKKAVMQLSVAADVPMSGGAMVEKE